MTNLDLQTIKSAPKKLGLTNNGLMREIYGKSDGALWQKWATGKRAMPLIPQMILADMLAGVPKFLIGLTPDEKDKLLPQIG